MSRRRAFERIAGRLVEAIRAALPLDGVVLDLHGAMVCTHLDDGEGELLARVRDAIGPDVPVVASLDLHANVHRTHGGGGRTSWRPYRTYPHVDMAATGARAAEWLRRPDRRMGGPEKTTAPRALPHADRLAVHGRGGPHGDLYARIGAAQRGRSIP